MIVIDSSLLTDALTDDGPMGELAEAELTADPHWVAPGHLRVEVTSAIRGRWIAGKLSPGRADEAVRVLNEVAISYLDWAELAERVWELRHNANSYDASYIAAAEARGCRLVTTDGKLRDCPGRRCEITVVGARA